jgi:hypothetical protein
MMMMIVIATLVFHAHGLLVRVEFECGSQGEPDLYARAVPGEWGCVQWGGRLADGAWI